jgi:hypothetical protein
MQNCTLYFFQRKRSNITEHLLWTRHWSVLRYSELLFYSMGLLAEWVVEELCKLHSVNKGQSWQEISGLLAANLMLLQGCHAILRSSISAYPDLGWTKISLKNIGWFRKRPFVMCWIHFLLVTFKMWCV